MEVQNGTCNLPWRVASSQFLVGSMIVGENSLMRRSCFREHKALLIDYKFNLVL
jgi:hypothetical protein